MPTLSTGAAGVPASNKVPAIFLEVAFGAGVNTAGGLIREVLLLGNKTSAGSATADTEVKLLTSLTDAETFFGKGSELALMYEAAAGKAPGATLRGIAITEAAGAKATATITVVGAATGTDTYSVFIHGVQVDVAVASGDVIGTIATNIAAAINGSGGKLKTLGVTAAAVLGVATVTARHNGTRGNLITIRQKVGTGITGSAFTLSGALLSGGTGTDSLTAALATAVTQKYSYYVAAQADTATLQLLQTQLTTMAGPLTGKRQVAVYGSRDTLATATTQVQTLNENRMQAVWQKNSETLPGVMAAAFAAHRSVSEGQKISANHDGVDLFPYVLAPPTESDWADATTQGAALNVGLTPIGVDSRTKRPYIVRSITAHSQAGGAPDVRTLDTTKIVVPDLFADTLASGIPSEFPNLNLVDDPVDPGADELPPGTTTPARIKSFCISIARGLAAEGHLTDIDSDVKTWAFNMASATSPGRVNATMSISVIDGFHQFSGAIRQIA